VDNQLRINKENNLKIKKNSRKSVENQLRISNKSVGISRESVKTYFEHQWRIIRK